LFEVVVVYQWREDG